MTTQEKFAIFDKFLNEQFGEFIERVDSDALNQCVDLAIYFLEYLGFPRNIYSGVAIAEDIYTKWSHPQFIKIPNTADYIPIKGDTVVFKRTKPGTGNAGHVVEATGEGDLNTFVGFSQNDPAGTNARLVRYNYQYVLGAQRLITTSTPGGGGSGGTGGNVDINLKAKTQIDKSLNALKQEGEIADDASENWLLVESNPDLFSGKIKSVLADLKSNRTRAGRHDQLVNYLYHMKLTEIVNGQPVLIIPTDDSRQITFDMVKKAIQKIGQTQPVDVAAIIKQAKKDQKEADILDLQDDSQ